jgi:hypothetical protein
MSLSKDCLVQNMQYAQQATIMETLSPAVRKNLYAEALQREKNSESITGIGIDLAVQSMLSGLGTPTVNVLSMMIQSILKPTLESIGLITDSIKLTKGGREWNQVRSMWAASVDGFAIDSMYFREGFRKGYSLERDINIRQLGMTAKDWKAFLKDTMNIDDPKDLDIRQAEDIMLDMQDYMHDTIGNTKFGKMFNGRGATLLRWPTKIIVGIDEYGKARFRRQSMFQMASKFAKEDSKLGIKTHKEFETNADGTTKLGQDGNPIEIKGADGQEGFDALYMQYKKDLFTDKAQNLMWDKRIQQFVFDRKSTQKELTGKVTEDDKTDYLKESRAAMSLVRDDALYNAFQQKLAGTPRAVQQIRHKHPAFSLFVPFIKTPWNIIKEGYSYIPIIPAIRASYTTKEGIKKELFNLAANVIPLHGPPAKMSYDQLIPRQILGMTMFATIGTMFDQESITGHTPRNAGERQRWADAGIKPYSIKIGDTWVGYHRFEPIATPLSMAADLFSLEKEYSSDTDINTDEFEELKANLIYMIKSNVTSKSFVEGMHTLTGALVDPNVSLENGLIETVVRPFTPAILAQTAKIMDGYERQTTNTWDRLQARIPIFREQLPKKFGVYGDAKKVDLSTALTSVPLFDSTTMTPVQQEMMRVEWDKGGITNKFKGVKLDRDQLADLRELNAKLLTPILETIISSPSYKAAPDSLKRKALDKMSRNVKKSVGQQMFYKLQLTDPVFARKFLSAYYMRMGYGDMMPENLKD